MHKRLLHLFLLFSLMTILFACQKEQLNRNAVEDDELIKEYLKKNNISATKASSGFYYLFEVKNESGPRAGNGKTAYIHYVAKKLDGEVIDKHPDDDFDPTMDTYYFRIFINNGQIIRAWYEALLMMRQGDKIRIFSPRHLLNGPSPFHIPHNTVLEFELELGILE